MTSFFFFSKSADKMPGKGANESISDCDTLKYQNLSKISNWRIVLSNFYECEFEYDGLHYRSAEHAFQGCKIALVDKLKGNLFALESKSKIALGNGDVARKNRKLVTLSQLDLAQWNSIKHDTLKDILYAKFSQVEFAGEVLLATNDAQLWHGTRGVPKARQVSLEEIRGRLQIAMNEKETIAVKSKEEATISRKRKTNNSSDNEV